PATVTALRTEARRLNRILSDFLRFARPQEARRAPADIRDVVQHVGALIREDRSRGARVDVKVAVDPAVPRFAFDRDQLTQVLWNVALNGVQAMNGRGRLTLDVAREDHHVALAGSGPGPCFAGAGIAWRRPTVSRARRSGWPSRRSTWW